MLWNNAGTTEEAMGKIYKASLSRSQNREAWSIIFRHPVRKDKATGQSGLRVRQGLGTKDEQEAELLVQQMNEILADPSFWDASARPRAEATYDGRIVEIFYYKLTSEPTDFFSVRESILPLPAMDSDYRRILLVGTTGSGKTTVARQLLGTDPRSERFPSTSTGKTTIADMEMVLDSGLFRAVVTFMSHDQVLDYVQDCVSAAALGCARNEENSNIVRLLLSHVSQRFRLSYMFGNGPYVERMTDLDEYDTEEEILEDSGDAVEPIDLSVTNNQIASWVERLRTVATTVSNELRAALRPGKGDERVFEELFEEELDSRLHDDDDCQALVDEIMDEIDKRFELLAPGRVEKNRQGWPELWTWETEDRKAFLKTVARFSSNHAKYFGSLLSPLVNGIRVVGPFQPTWADEQPRLVIFDGEGLGHTPDSSASIPTSLTRRFDDSDIVLLVDNATQPMQAAPVVLMKSLAAAGKTSKLMMCLTHMDQVRGDNIPTFALRKQHVLASAENVLTSIGEQLGRFAERALRQSMQRGCFFVGSIDGQLIATSKVHQRSIDQLLELLAAVNAVRQLPELAVVRPVYDRVNLVLAVKNATEKFHEEWAVRLGLRSKPGFPKEHWTRVKALSRRLALGWSDEYDTLKPVADLHRNLQNDIYVFIQSPMKWDGPEPDDDEKQSTFDRLAEGISSRSLQLVTRRIRQERTEEWQLAYNCKGLGSTFSRAEIIDNDIYDRAAPIPDVAPSPDRNAFLHEVIAAVDEAAGVLDVQLA
jgi:energy-coupling factor transporter ATP-binding protein EcfA2